MTFLVPHSERDTENSGSVRHSQRHIGQKKRLNLTNKPRLFNCCNTDVNTVHEYKEVHPKTVHDFIMQPI